MKDRPARWHPRPDDRDHWLSVGDVARETGVAVATLRMWESRHGFPAPQRTEAGHRRYDAAVVARVLDIQRRRDGGMQLSAAIAASVPQASVSVYATLMRTHPGQTRQRLRRSTLVAMSRALEDELTAVASQGYLFGAFQTGANFEASSGRWNELARTARSTVVLADFGGDSGAVADREGDIQRVHVAADAPMRREWAVACDCPELPVALSAWELPGQEGRPDDDRVFESMWTVDPAAVRATALACCAVALGCGYEPAADLMSGPLAGAPADVPAPSTFSRLALRTLAYVESSVGRVHR